MKIEMRGAREHNLKDVDAVFGDGLTVVTGVSGSGKTSLVFDTLYHEARRRFLEIFTLGSSALRLAPAKVGSITGLGPAVAVGQNLLNRNPASTLATASGLHPFFRLLYANFSQRRCSFCGASLAIFSEDVVIEILHNLVVTEGSIAIYAPLVHTVRGSHRSLLEMLENEFDPGIVRVDGVQGLPDKLDPESSHDIQLLLKVADSKILAGELRATLRQAKALGVFSLIVETAGNAHKHPRSLPFAPVCTECGTWFSELRTTHFLIDCPYCSGEGCVQCQESGMHPEAAAATWQGMRLRDLLKLSVDEAHRLFTQPGLPSIAGRLQTEILRRLEALSEVGLGYINLERSSPTLSRGEAQRVRLAVALTSRLEDLLHVLDEPTVGQHPADVARLLPVFRKLGGPVIFVEHDRLAAALADRAIDLGPGAGKAGGEIIFEGTPRELWQADTPTGRWFSGRERGAELKALKEDIPRKNPVLAGESDDSVKQFLIVRGAHFRNLQGIDIPIPIGRLTVISGVSGSGKSTLVEDVLVASLEANRPVGCLGVDGPRLKPLLVDQSPIGINPRSNPATYTGLAGIIRHLFSAETGLAASKFSFNRSEGACPTCNGMGAIEVQMRFLPSTWIPCEDCEGLRFSEEVLAARVVFGEQNGLLIKLSIADFLSLSVQEAQPLLATSSSLSASKRNTAGNILQALLDVGLGYLPLGQPSPTLSGGEAQRVKLARSLGKRSLEGQLLILDEPSTGLHPQDVAGLLVVLHRLAESGATLVVVEHNTDILRSADWIIDLGPGAGPEGGRLLYAGTPDRLLEVEGSLTAQALREEQAMPFFQQKPKHDRPLANNFIQIIGARAHNLQNISVRFPKGALTVVSGVSGSGKSSLVGDVLEAEAHRRYLESLSMYERQSTREGPEAPVDQVTGLGVAVTITTERRMFQRRATVGTATELAHHLAVLLADLGERSCLECGYQMTWICRKEGFWSCPACGAEALIAEPRHFNPSVYAAACLRCNGVGVLQQPVPEKLIIHPEKPLCAGAMYSPGFFPQGYLGKPFNGGYYLVQALAARYMFDPFETPWNLMSQEAQQAFLFGTSEPLEVHYESRKGQRRNYTQKFPGFYGWVGDWDVGGTYTEGRPCPVCNGGGLRPEYACVTLKTVAQRACKLAVADNQGVNYQALTNMPLDELAGILDQLADSVSPEQLEKSHHFAAASLVTARRRTHFLIQVGLGYLNLVRPTGTLSAGEAQRVRLAGLLGSELTSLTILLDEPSRGMHPIEVDALLDALKSLSKAGNTVIVVEHDLSIIAAADCLVDMGPGAGRLGGRVMVQGRPVDLLRDDKVKSSVTLEWLRKERGESGQEIIRRGRPDLARRSPRHLKISPPERWMVMRGSRANNLKGDEVRFPLNRLTGVCGVSGSGKSTLVIDTLGRVLAPKKQTTSVAYEPVIPGEHDSIEGAPERVIIVDQTRRGIGNPADFMSLTDELVRLFAEGESAASLGLNKKDLARRCSACYGSGVLRTEMGFLPDVYSQCDVCAGTGFSAEAWDVMLNGLALPEVFSLTIDEVKDLFGYVEKIISPLEAAIAVGLGYLNLRQPGVALSGGEAQRLKIARELCRKVAMGTLYILDEPTVGQHAEDVARLISVLCRLVDAGHTVLVVEHNPQLLAGCDWLVELGPVGGPQGGYVIAAGDPAALAVGSTPTAPYLLKYLEARR